jgi:hypothetical protein
LMGMCYYNTISAKSKSSRITWETVRFKEALTKYFSVTLEKPLSLYSDVI